MFKPLVIIVLISLTNAQFNNERDDYGSEKSRQNLSGKVALVTGSSAGIGEAIVKVLSFWAQTL